MATAEKVQLRNPDPDKSGVRIDRSKYDVIRRAIVKCLRRSPGITFMRLLDEVAGMVPDFPGNTYWYATCVKLDMEARENSCGCPALDRNNWN